MASGNTQSGNTPKTQGSSTSAAKVSRETYEQSGPEERAQKSAATLEEAMADQDKRAREQGEELTKDFPSLEERQAKAQADAQAAAEQQEQADAEAQADTNAV